MRAVWLVLVLLGAASAQGDLPSRADDTLRVLQFNLWQEGTSVPGGFEQIVDVIAASDADLVTLSEVRNYEGRDLHARLIAALADEGEAYYGRFVAGDVGLLSRWPIEHAEPVSDDVTSVIAYHLRHPRAGRLVVAVAHLDYTHYAVYLPRGYDGVTWQMIDDDGDGEPDPVTAVDAVLTMDAGSTRDESHAAFLAYAARDELADVPVIYAGDYNEGSHLDWTDATAELFDHHGVVIAWPNSVALAEAGFVDAWRQVHPDPVRYHGATWPSSTSAGESTAWIPKADERDRIDVVFHNGVGLAARAAWIVGPRSYWVRGELVEPDTDARFALSDLPWPSDHKGVLVDFELTAP